MLVSGPLCVATLIESFLRWIQFPGPGEGTVHRRSGSRMNPSAPHGRHRRNPSPSAFSLAGMLSQGTAPHLGLSTEDVEPCVERFPTHFGLVESPHAAPPRVKGTRPSMKGGRGN